MEISNNSVKLSSFNNEQKQKLARLASKYGMEIRPCGIEILVNYSERLEAKIRQIYLTSIRVC